jgi:hypothetical protein
VASHAEEFEEAALSAQENSGGWSSRNRFDQALNGFLSSASMMTRGVMPVRGRTGRCSAHIASLRVEEKQRIG